VEQHGKNPLKNVIAIIPARLFSTRLPNKLLLDLAGKPLILHTLEQTKKARNISRVIVAADSEEILRVVNESGNEAVLTSENHQSGSDRIAEVAETLPKNSIIVNVQGDEPLISPETIEKAVEAVLQNETIEMATTCEPVTEIKDVLSTDVVKVVTDENNFALYFSRSPIPFPRDAVKKYGSLENALQNEPNLLSLYRKHTGLYVYRREFLLRYTKLVRTNIEKTELLEQLRALENGARIKVVEVSETSIGVDTREDFERVRQIIESRKNNSESFVVRKATIDDVPQIAGVHVESWQKSFRGIAPQKFLDNLSIEKREKAFRERFFDEDYKMFVAETAENKIVGFADFGKGRDDQPEYKSELYAIYLLPEFQRKGIGGELFKNGVKDLLERGYNSMYLQSLEVSPYRAFYEKMGGKVIARNTHKLGDQDFATLFYGWEDLNKI
jgi:3-deoxy-manno-octulosonate cytidylyltransferase (CMP-KDO synthetase)